MKLLETYIKELLNELAPACRYENVVIKSLSAAGAIGRIKRSPCSDSQRPDADIKVDGETHFIEIKMSPHAQMGGGSVGYSLSDKRFTPAGQNSELSEMIAEFLNETNDSSLHRGLKNVLLFLSKKSGKKMTSFPCSGFEPDAWTQAVQLGLLQMINRTVESTTNVIADHYARKNTYYIQIGGAGFFRLSEANPANLPVPPLSGKVKLEIRAAKSGDVGELSKAGIRVQARLISLAKSPYTLDDPASIKKMFQSR